MKVTLFLTSFWLFLASFFAPVSNGILSVKVTSEDGPAVGALVKAYQKGEFIRGASADIDGMAKLELAPGPYDIEVSLTGAVTRHLSTIILEGKTSSLDVVLSYGNSLSEVVITAPKPSRDTRESRSTAQTVTRSDIKSLPGKAKKQSAPSPKSGEKPGAVAADDVKVKGARETPTDYYIDGIRVSGEAPAVKDISGPDKARKESKPAVLDAERYEEAMFEDKKAPAPSAPVTQPAPRAGLLTAGEWNDLHNWNRHWVDLLADGETDPYQQMYAFYPKQRYTLLLTNENDVPLADVVTHLKNKDGKTIWEARTDNTGKAELWAALFSPDKEKGEFVAECWHEGRKYELKSLKPAADGFNTLKINAECKAPQNVDIVWAVDATGSMGDEIEYLKTELLDVIGRAQSRNEDLHYRMGTVFYRDQGDEYVTKSSPLDADILKTVSFIRQQNAGGGGDFPEAVHSALEEAIFKQAWSENAIARICFLVLDASPHQEPEVIASLQKSIQEAAKRGIRIVPVTASGIQKDTEFLMKFFGLATNGTYVFLTDHSGIGGKHLEPTTDEYKVEALNDLLVRLIGEYTSIQTCEGKSEIRFENDPQQQPGPVPHALYYPNPAVDHFSLELPYEVQSVTLYDSEGKAVQKLEKPQAGTNTVQINQLAAGIYTIRILNNGLMQSGKLVVVRS